MTFHLPETASSMTPVPLLQQCHRRQQRMLTLRREVSGSPRFPFDLKHPLAECVGNPGRESTCAAALRRCRDALRSDALRHCGALRCTACAAVRCGALRCGALRCAAVRCGALRCVAVLGFAVVPFGASGRAVFA